MISVLMIVYLLGIRDGYITLWDSCSPEPLQVFPYRAEMLPVPDQRALENGIRISDQHQLQQLLEDYLS